MVKVSNFVIVYPKIVNNEGECDGVGGVIQEGRGVFGRGIAKRGKVGNEVILSNVAKLFEAGRPFLYFDVYIPLVN